MKNIRLSTLVGSLLLSTLAAHAATSTTTFQVTATVSSGCVLAASNHDFGIYSTSSATDNINGSNLLTATCTLAVPYTLGLNAGVGTGATAAARKMTRVGGTELLNYSLYQTIDRLLVLSDVLTLSGMGTGLATNHAVFGKIAAAQNVPAGNYVDTVTATITF